MGIIFDRCVDCKKRLFFPNSIRCKECERIKMDKWVKEHTFIKDEPVLVHDDDKFYGGPLEGIVIKKGSYVSGAWGYYDAHTTYTVRFADGKEIVYSPETLEKIKK